MMHNPHSNNGRSAVPDDMQFGKLPTEVVAAGMLRAIAGKPAALLTYMAYVAAANAKMESWPSETFIAQACGINADSVRRSRRALEDAGLITDTGKRRYRCKVYRITTKPRSDAGSMPRMAVGYDRHETPQSCGVSGVHAPVAARGVESRNPARRAAETPQPCGINREEQSNTKNAAHSLCVHTREMPPQVHTAFAPAGSQTLSEGLGSGFGLSGPDPDKPASTTRTTPSAKTCCTIQQAEVIYVAYPRKVGKRAALTAIQRAARRLAGEGKEDPAAYLAERTKAYAKSPAGQRPPPGSNDYRPHPATWFNDDRFDDDPDEWSKPNGNGRTAPNAAGRAASGTERAARERRAEQARLQGSDAKPFQPRRI